MKYLFRKPHAEGKAPRIKLGHLPLLKAERSDKGSSKVYGNGRIVFVKGKKEMDRGVKMGRGRALSDFLLRGVQRAREACGPGWAPAFPQHQQSPARRGIRIPGL